MTTISRLGIQGIRSFDHERLEVLEFQKPVTLIVGPNGSGKTTIIECLKMASSGSLPPNSKSGHGFIHDPQLAHLPEVKAQIRMLFKTGASAPREKEICAIRSFQLTNRRVGGRVKPQYKALDSVLRTEAEDGSKASLSHRCADMDTQVPELMGVSRAILENVIFCHQEDSSWPLMDSAAVKKRFDDIFGSTRYTQALKNIRDLARDWTKVTRERRAEADLTQAHMDQATKLKGQQAERQRIVEEISKELDNINAQVAEADEGTTRAEMELVKYESCGVRVSELRTLMARVEEDKRELIRGMEEKGQQVFAESYETLQEQVKIFREKNLVQCEHRMNQARERVKAGEVSFRAAVDRGNQLRRDMGETLASAELITSRKAELAERLQKTEQPSVSALRGRLDTMAAEFAKLERDQRTRDEQAQEALGGSERTLREAQLDTSRSEARLQDATAIIRRLEQELSTLSRAQPDLEVVVRQLRENEAHLGGKGSEAELRALEAKLEEIARQRHDLQYAISRKSSEVAQLEAQSGAHLEVDAMRRQHKEAEAELSGKVAEVRPRLAELLGQMPEVPDAEARVVSQLQQLEEQVKRHRQGLQEVHQRRSAAQARRGVAEGELKKLQAEEARLAQELGVSPMTTMANAAGAKAATFGVEEYQNRLAEQRHTVEMARKDLSMTESAQHMYEKFRDKSRAKNTCQFCRRCFDTPESANIFEESVEKLISKIPNFLEESKQRLEEAQATLQALEAKRPLWERLEALRRTDLPRKQQDMQLNVDEEHAHQQKAEPVEAEQRRLEDRLQKLQELRSEAAALTRLGRSVDELRAGVRAKEARLLGAGSKVSLQAERDQLRALQEQLGDKGREEDHIRSQRDVQAKQQEQMRTQSAELKGRMQLLQAQVARRGDVESELATRQAEARDCTEAARRSRQVMETTNVKVQELRRGRDEATARHRRELSARDGEVRTLQREVDALLELEKSIEVMQSRVADADALKARLAEADSAVRSAEREVDGLRLELEKENDRTRHQQNLAQALEANLRLKKLEAEAQRNQAETSQLMQDLGGRDLEALRRDVELCRKRSLEMQKQRSFREGSLTQTKEALSGIQVELSSPLYAGVEQRHREAIIKHESAAYAAKDLNRYHLCLDKALMKFHAMKMAEINRTIRDLWQKVYKGKDISCIQIRSDTDEAPEGSSAAEVEAAANAGRSLRSYNYRVVMIQGDSEMEMRGRCSAGQRVLASLIIRLALADSFCVNCGILALDEPTTNLDAQNIRGLAEALADIIEARRGTSRFQLVLITHDEEFVNHLCRMQVCDWYYRICKDDNGCSKIDKKDVRLLMD
eukprot:TRINITY_DN17002_c0_g1_i1.p1 TRINITY_DN17002_c0_g1~~TRINITY_DN17002_c0_g1_i1.p1  ORF type:complete len:1332 (+),score=479.23 TRINITY_DN17002_c0_g1_i1:114-4109(+)